jgi:periplasmic copper chaperone A
MIIASTEAVAPAPPASQPSPGDFFTHLCGTRVMANVTVSPGREGPIDVLVELEDANEQPLAVQGLSVTLSDPEREIAPVTAKADRISSDKRRVHMSASAAGKWLLTLSIEIAADDRVDIAAPILIEK